MTGHQYQLMPVNPYGPSAEERWEDFCANVIERIEAIRLEAAPTECQTCGSTTPPATKWCPGCQRDLPRSAFGQEQRYGHSIPLSRCRWCRRKVTQLWRRRKILRSVGVSA